MPMVKLATVVVAVRPLFPVLAIRMDRLQPVIIWVRGIMFINQSGSDVHCGPEHKTRTRDHIVRNAARKLRAEGLDRP